MGGRHRLDGLVPPAAMPNGMHVYYRGHGVGMAKWGGGTDTGGVIRAFFLCWRIDTLVLNIGITC